MKGEIEVEKKSWKKDKRSKEEIKEKEKKSMKDWKKGIESEELKN